MPSRETLLSFREGIRAIASADDYATLKDTIIRMMAITSPEDSGFARDAIARTMRKKQAAELQIYRGHPQKISQLDQKYRDLYVVLRSAKTAPKAKPTPAPTPVTPAPKKVAKKKEDKKQMVKASAFGAFNAPMMVLNWIKSKKRPIILGTALATSVGGAYWIYRFFSKDEDNDQNPEKESNFDKTIKSIQRYRAFTQASKDPDFMGDYEALLSGKSVAADKKKAKKKPELDKSTEWEYEEKALMKSMDTAFHAIGTKPKVKYDLPELPAPRDIDPKAIIGPKEAKAEKIEKPKKKRRKKPSKSKEKPVSEDTSLSVEVKPKKKKAKKRETKSSDASPQGRLIPIVKRTKRVKKVRA